VLLVENPHYELINTLLVDEILGDLKVSDINDIAIEYLLGSRVARWLFTPKHNDQMLRFVKSALFLRSSLRQQFYVADIFAKKFLEVLQIPSADKAINSCKENQLGRAILNISC
jgi:hypothetical protein